MSTVTAQTTPARALIVESRYLPMFLLSPDGTQLALFESPILWGQDTEVTPFPQGALRLWLVDLTQDEPTFRILQGHTDMAASAAFSEDGSTLVTHHRNGEFIFWDAGTGDLIRRIRTPLFVEGQAGPFTYVAETEQIIPTFTGQRLAASALIINAETAELRYLLPRLLNFNDILPPELIPESTSIAAPVLANSAVVAVTGRGNIWRFDIATGEAEQLVTMDEAFPTFRYGKMLSTSEGLFNQQVYLLRQGREEELNGLYTLDVETGALENVVPEAQGAAYDHAAHRLVWAGEDVTTLNITPADDPTNVAMTLRLDAEVLAAAEVVALSRVDVSGLDLGSTEMMRASFITGLNQLQMQNNILVLGNVNRDDTGRHVLLVVDVAS